jgi:anti-sigma regulatory factor (Ser/Thr protein kinase)
MIEFTFEDDGTPFNPLSASAPSAFTSVENAKAGGLGISLVAKFSSKLRYERPAKHIGDNDFTPRNRLVVAIAT